MGDNPKLGKAIKKTQDLLGKHVKKPPLSEKNLGRPPFRFLHDVVTNVISSTGYMSGVFTPEEMDVANVSTREAKAAFMQKLVQAIKDTTGENLSIKVSKVLAGQEPDKTNEMLQALARAIEKNAGSGVVTKLDPKPSKGAPARDSKKPGAKPAPGTKSDATTKTTAGAGAKTSSQAASIKAKVPEKPKGRGQDPSKSSNNEKDNKSNSASKVEEQEPLPSTSKVAQAASIAVEELDSALKQSDSSFGDLKADERSIKSTAGSRRSSGLRRESSISRPTPEENASSFTQINEDNKGKDSDEPDKVPDAQDAEVVEVEVDDEQHESLYHDFKSSAVKASMDTLSVPLSPLIPDAIPQGLSSESPDQGASAEEGDGDANTNFTFTPSLTAKNGERRDPFGQSGLGSDSQDSSDVFGSKSSDSGARASSTARTRPGTGTTRQGSARPPSARPAPPRPRSSMIQEAVQESNFRPPTGKVSNVILETQDQDDDDTFVIRETIVSKGPGLSDLDEGPELALSSVGVKAEDQMADFLVPPEQRGLLVNQILETQKELEDTGDSKKDKLEADRSTVHEVTTADIEKLKNLIQASARNANPLGKLLDYVREDVDSMQNEIAKWRDESRQLDGDLETARKSSESALQPLQDHLKEVESQIRDKEDAIAMSKMSILRNQERIDKILAGLDQILTSRTRLPIPTKEEFLTYVNENQRAGQKPIFSAFSAAKPININNSGEMFRDDDDEDNHSRQSSGLGNSLGRFSGGGMPSMKSNFDVLDDDDDDLDSEKFDAWKVINGN